MSVLGESLNNCLFVRSEAPPSNLQVGNLFACLVSTFGCLEWMLHTKIYQCDFTASPSILSEELMTVVFVIVDSVC